LKLNFLLKGGIMRFARTILIMIFLTAALLACQTTNPSTQLPQEPVIQPDSPGSLPESSATQTLTPTQSEENTNMAPVTLPDEASEKMVALVKQHLAQRLSLAVDQIVLSDIKNVVWRDAGLGCAKPGVDYIQVETPGYKISLEARGNTYVYHTDATKRFVPCNK
jgi:hypothetical protein